MNNIKLYKILMRKKEGIIYWFRISIISILFAGAGAILLSGCSGANSSLEKDHIMNNGCFITCKNRVHTNFGGNIISRNNKNDGPQNRHIEAAHLRDIAG